jgi:hypothetical protein
VKRHRHKAQKLVRYADKLKTMMRKRQLVHSVPLFGSVYSKEELRQLLVRAADEE